MFRAMVEQWSQTQFKVQPINTELVEGDALEAIVEFYREPSDREVPFVTPDMSHFRRSWFQLIKVHVWVFATYDGRPCGSVTAKLEKLDQDHEDPMYIGAFRSSATMEYTLNLAGAKLPADVTFEYRIQRKVEHIDFAEMEKWDLSTKIHTMDLELLDAQYEPKLPDPHRIRYDGRIIRPFSVKTTTKWDPDYDPCCVHVSLIVENCYVRKLSINELHFRLDKDLADIFDPWRWIRQQPPPIILEPGETHECMIEFYLEPKGHEGNDFQSPLDVAFSWHDKDGKDLWIYTSTHPFKWAAPKKSLEVDRIPVVRLDENGEDCFANLDMSPPEPPPPVQCPEFEVPPDKEILRIRRVFEGPFDPVTGIRIYP